MSDSKKSLFKLDKKTTTNFTEQKSFTPVGEFKPLSKNAKDPREGYSAVIRLLPNFTQDQDVEDSAIRVTSFFVSIDEYPELNGVIYSKTNFNERCPLGTLYKKFTDSKSTEDNDKAALFRKTTKYYSYALIVEDENHPENEGKIMIWGFGSKMKDKIEAESKGKNKIKQEINVYDLAVGKNLQILVTGQGQQTSYDKCVFDEQPSPIAIKGKGQIPTIEDEDGTIIIDPDYQELLVKFLLKRPKNLEDYKAQPWDEETLDKVNSLIAYLNGDTPVSNANKAISNAAKPSTNVAREDKPASTTKVQTSTVKSQPKSAADFFSDMDDEE